MTPDTLAVVVNWRRPANIPIVLESLRRQSHPVFIALVDNADGSEFETSASVRADADVVFAVGPRNLGPCCRFLPPLAMPEFRYVFFSVDDHVPGDNYIAYLRSHYNWRSTASIGQDGRTVDMDARLLGRRRTRMAPDRRVCVDVITTSELTMTDYVQHASLLRSDMRNELGDAACGDLLHSEDDLVFNFAVSHYTGLPCALTPAPPSAAESWRGGGRLPAPHALSAREDHRERRDRFVRQAIDIGWRSRAGHVIPTD